MGNRITKLSNGTDRTQAFIGAQSQRNPETRTQGHSSGSDGCCGRKALRALRAHHAITHRYSLMKNRAVFTEPGSLIFLYFAKARACGL